jgi:hypothetical protein
VLGMVDHYLWTMPLGRVIGWAGLALLAARHHPDSKNESAP